MPRVELISSDEDDDIWDYRSQTQRARKTKNDVSSKSVPTSQLPSKKQPSKCKSRSSLSQKRVKTEDKDSVTINKSQKHKKATQKKKSKVKVEVKTERTPNAKQDGDRTGRCPVCQMPFSILSMIETPSWHVDQCLDVPYSSKNECDAGLECDSEFASHYKKFRHTRLARSRRKSEIVHRDTGNVDSAKTKLSFDAGSNDKRLVVPGSSADCVIILDSSQDSSYSQRSTFDVQEEDLQSPVEKSDGDQVCLDKFKATKLEKDHTVTGNKSNGIRTEKKSCKEDILDKNKNILINQSRQDLENKIFGTNCAEETHLNLIDLDYEEGDSDDLEEVKSSDGENADTSAGLTRVTTVDLSDDSCGSIQDIDNLVDETRSLSDMLNDALAPDDVIATEESEVDSDKVVEKQKYEFKSRTKSSTYKNENSETEADSVVDENVEDDDEDDLISLFTNRTKKKSGDRMAEQSAISGLRETPAKLTDSDSSSDWEILKTTLTQPSFEQDNVRKDIDAKTVLEEDNSLFYKASLKTPTKACETVSATQDKEKKGTVENDCINSVKNDITPKRGFFATKMLQNVHKDRSKSSIDLFSLGLDTAENIDRESTNNNEQLKDKSTQETSVRKTLKDEDICTKNKHPQLKRKRHAERDESKNVVGSIISTHLLPGNHKYPSEIRESATNDTISTKLKNSTPPKEEVKEKEVNEKKPKIELKPKTPTKRKLNKNGQKQIGDNSENKDRKYPKLDSFFNPKKEIKREEISIQTDSESSGDCDRFNKIGKFVKCCANCTKEKNHLSNYANCMNDMINVTNHGDNKSEQDKVKCGTRTSFSFKPSQDTCDSILDSISEVKSCGGCESRPSSNSLNFTISGSCHSCSQLREMKSQSKNNRRSISQEFSQQSRGQNCLQQSQGRASSEHLQGLASPEHLQGQSCSCSQHSRCSEIQRRKNCKSQNNSFNSSCSQNTLQFNIENVCTLSQNTYSALGGGFIIETEDNASDPVNNSHCVNYVNSQILRANSTSQNIENAGVSMSDKEVESILQIRKSATDILMASSRLLYSKSAKNNSTASGGQKMGNVSMKNGVNTNVRNSTAPNSTVGAECPSTAKKPMENASQRGRGWNRSGTSTSTETSSDTNDGRRKCPFYKKIPDTCLTVDAFRYGNIPDCKAYVLSHFHYDHYMGLTKHFRNPIYCSKITGNLVKKKIGVDTQYIHTIPLYTPTLVQNVEITFLEANHCPGAVLILFKLKSGKVYLHTGDFRASKAMELYPQLQNLRVHSLYLDTTYCDPQYDFPPQEEVVQFTVNLVLNALTNNPKTLIVCGTYTIGKERIFQAIAEELDCKICVTRDKKAVLDCMEDEKLKQRISLRWEDSRLHVVPMNKINYNCLQDHLLLNGKKYNSVLGIEPTGWTHNKKTLSLHHIKPKVNKDNIKIYGVPYSEHSSFLELKRFVQFTRPAKILPTVNNGNVHSRHKMEVIFEAWMEDLNTNRATSSRQSSITGWTK